MNHGINCSSLSLSSSLSPHPRHPTPCHCVPSHWLSCLLPPPCLSGPFPLTWSLGAASVSPAPATVLFPCCAHGVAPLPTLGLASCCPCVLEQKQTGSMDSDDFRALLISTGYSLVCSLCLPCCGATPLPQLLPLSFLPPFLLSLLPPFLLLLFVLTPIQSFQVLGDTPPPDQCSLTPLLLLLHLLGWGRSDDFLSLPPPFLEVCRERRSGFWLSPFSFSSLFLPHPPELTCEPRAEEQQTCLMYTPLPTSQKPGRGGVEGACLQPGAHGAVTWGAKTIRGRLMTWHVHWGRPCPPSSVLLHRPSHPARSNAACPLPPSCLSGRC